MEAAEAIKLIEKIAIAPQPQRWLELGCGSGTFTYALATLLPPGSAILAVDRQPQHLRKESGKGVRIQFLQADFEDPGFPAMLPLLPAPDEDFDKAGTPAASGNAAGLPEGVQGVLMANSLHYIRDKFSFMSKLEAGLHGLESFLVVEYDTTTSNPWVPYPLPFYKLAALCTRLGYRRTVFLGSRPSRFGEVNMYAAQGQKLAP